MYVWFQSDFLWESDNPEPEESGCFVTLWLFPPTLRHLLQASKTSVTNLLLTETNSASLSHTSNSMPCQDDQVSPRVSASTTPGLNTNRRLRSSPPSPLTLVPPHHSPSQDRANFSSGFTDHLKGGGRNWEGYLESEAVVLQIHSCLSALRAISRPLGLLSTIAKLGQEESKRAYWWLLNSFDTAKQHQTVSH